MRILQRAILLFAAFLAVMVPSREGSGQSLSEPVVLNDDGAWCWFQDERCVVIEKWLYVGSVANGTRAPERRGDVELVAVHRETHERHRYELHDGLEADDHDVPALWQRPDGRLLAVYTKHGSEPHFYQRVSDSLAENGSSSAGPPTEWQPVTSCAPSPSSRVTYSNLIWLAEERGGQGRLYNFFRGLDNSFKPSWACSDDWGDTWQTGGVVVDVPAKFRHRPYVRYAGNGRDTIHLLYTDGHPRDFDNSVYHVFYRGGNLHQSDGTVIGPLEKGLSRPEQGTVVFRGDADHVAWVSDIHLDGAGHAVAVFSVQRGSGGLPSGDPAAGADHRYHYARWDGRSWQESEIAIGGTRLYPGEDDYTGNVCLDPQALERVYLSADVDPQTGTPLISPTDSRRHYELFEGTTRDFGQTWQWTPVTSASTMDNLRPLVPLTDDGRTHLLWFRGSYRTYRDYDAQVVMLTLPPSR